MPVFNEIRIHHKHLGKVFDKRWELQDSVPMPVIDLIGFNAWKQYITKLNARKALTNHKVKHIFE